VRLLSSVLSCRISACNRRIDGRLRSSLRLLERCRLRAVGTSLEGDSRLLEEALRLSVVGGVGGKNVVMLWCWACCVLASLEMMAVVLVVVVAVVGVVGRKVAEAGIGCVSRRSESLPKIENWPGRSDAI
jgi:hypothetical protein